MGCIFILVLLSNEFHEKGKQWERDIVTLDTLNCCSVSLLCRLLGNSFTMSVTEEEYWSILIKYKSK